MEIDISQWLKKDMSTKITEVSIIPIKPRNGLVAIASCVIDNKLYVGSIGIYTVLEQAENSSKQFNGRYRLTYPTKESGRNAINIFHPITKECGQEIEDEVIKEYKKLVNEE